MKIGIIREEKTPKDFRVPFTPAQVKEIIDTFNVEVKVQSSTIRIFKDEEYAALGIEVADNIADCDVMMGVKEVPIKSLIPNKTYFFFSHTIKEQPYNRDLLKAIIEKKIRLIDYEPLKDKLGNRVVAFGRWAGIVGAYNALWTFGKRYNIFNLPRAHELYDFNELKEVVSKIKIPHCKIVLTGSGRVAKGAIEVLLAANINKISPSELLENTYQVPVFTQLNSRDYHISTVGKPFVRSEFYQKPHLFESDFLKYAHKSDILIACSYWDPRAPVLFNREQILDSHFKIRIIADITCDIEGSIPATKRASTIADPIYDYNPSDDVEEPALIDEGNITMMAVDNLPCELPRNASEDFGNMLIKNVLPSMIVKDSEGLIHRATITKEGKLNEPFAYLEDFLKGK